MTQQEVINVLSKERHWLSTIEIAKRLKKSRSSESVSIKKLLEQGILESKNVRLPSGIHLRKYRLVRGALK